MNILISMKKEMFETSKVGGKGINDSLRIFNFYTRRNRDLRSPRLILM